MPIKTKTVSKMSMDHNLVQHKIEFKVAGPKAVDNTFIFDMIAKRERLINDELSKVWLEGHGYDK